MDYNIAIIIAAYNAETYITETLDSIKKQTYNNWRVYIVNDGSTDNTKSIAEKYSREDDRIILLNKPNGGVVAARRYGIEKVEDCQFATFVDAYDYYITEDILEKINHSINDENADCVCFNYLINGMIPFSKFKERYIFKNEEDIIKNIYARTIIDGNFQFAVYPIDALLKQFEILECANDDYINKISVMRECNKILYIPEEAYYYRVNPKSLTHRLPREEDADYYYHAVKHTADSKRRFKNLDLEADYFANWILLWLAANLSKDRSCKSLNIYKPIIQELKKNDKVFMNNCYFSKKDKLTYALVRCGVFGFAYKIYHLVK